MYSSSSYHPVYWPGLSLPVPLLAFCIRLCVDRLSVWPQHHLKHADVPAQHPTGYLLHPHPGLPHLRLCPSGQLQLHQHRHQHRHSQCHHRSAALLHLSCDHSCRLSCLSLYCNINCSMSDKFQHIINGPCYILYIASYCHKNYLIDKTKCYDELSRCFWKTLKRHVNTSSPVHLLI